MVKIRQYSLLFIILFGSFSTSVALGFENCAPVSLLPASNEIEELDEIVEKIVGEIPAKVLAITVSHDGTGSVKVLMDTAGNLLGVRLDYKNSKGKTMQQTKTIEEFNAGQSVAFTVDGQTINPLVLKAKAGTVISKEHGGSFDFVLLSDTDPSKYIHYELTLAKAGTAWKVMKGNKVVTSTTIAPNISWTLSWEGTFKSASFQ